MRETIRADNMLKRKEKEELQQIHLIGLVCAETCQDQTLKYFTAFFLLTPSHSSDLYHVHFSFPISKSHNFCIFCLHNHMKACFLQDKFYVFFGRQRDQKPPAILALFIYFFTAFSMQEAILQDIKALLLHPAYLEQ